MKKFSAILLMTVGIFAAAAAEDRVPRDFQMLKIGNSANARFTEPEPGVLELKMISAAQNNYMVLCQTSNIPVSADAKLSYRMTPAERYADGAQFTVAVAYTVPGDSKWKTSQRPGTLLFREEEFDLSLVNDFGIPENGMVKQIKFVFNAMRVPAGKEVCVTVSGLKLSGVPAGQ